MAREKVDAVRLMRNAVGDLRRRVLEFVAKRKETSEKKNGLAVSCSRGCDHCCYLLVTGTLPEAVDLVAGAADAGKRDELVAKIPVIKEQFVRVLDPQLTTGQWLDEQHPCPFLSGHECSAYHNRPLACASYYVFSPREQCGPPSKQDVLEVNTRGWLMPANGELEHVSHMCGLPFTYAPLPFLIPLAVILIDRGSSKVREVLRRIGMDRDDSFLRWVSLS